LQLPGYSTSAPTHIRTSLAIRCSRSKQLHKTAYDGTARNEQRSVGKRERIAAGSA
jgi:hypothetical protein